jgi:two-component system, chemotaxis family, sensor kinase CheA
MNQDPYKYFRIEARELLEGLNQGVLEIERNPASKELVGRILRFAHTLKGASRVVKQTRIADLTHSVEDALAPHRENPGTIPRECVDKLLRLLDGIAEGVACLDAPREPGLDSLPAPEAESPFQTVRVEIEDLDSLLESVFETETQLSTVRGEIEAIEELRSLAGTSLNPRMRRQARDLARTDDADAAAGLSPWQERIQGSLGRLGRSLSEGIERAQGKLAQVRSTADRFRLIAASTVFPSLERAVRDVAQSLQKRVELHTSGGENRIDSQVLAALRDALLHVVRNAVAHGIEGEAERAAAGKPAVGRVELSVLRRGNRVAFVCRDDGRGIDVEAVRTAAVRRGLLPSSEAASLALDEVIQLIFKAGVTTARTVTEVSGRGIGLDVVRDTVTRLKGEVKVETGRGRGTSLEVCVPVSLSSLAALVMEDGGVTAALPLEAVRSTLRVAPGDIVRSTGFDSILHQGMAIPFCPLAAALKREPSAAAGQAFASVIVVQAGADLAAVQVERLLGTAPVIVRPIPRWVAVDPVIAGAALDPAGQPLLVLDPGALVAAARIGRVKPAAPRISRPPILIIDDSLTTRMLEQSILESAGYKVELAVSAEEALAKARTSRYGLFIVDVEMPGMDGFGFIAQTRQDPILRGTPSILVSSRNSAEDRRRGEGVGASAYIVKSEFDQGYLLRTIRQLVG